MNYKKKTKISKWLSYILRHKPGSFGLELDKHGWLNVDDLLETMFGVNNSITLTVLKEVVAEDNKQRYSFNEDETKIRANQGHSIDVDVELEKLVPPEVLYHGTAERFVDSINRKGLVPKKRIHVHLSFDEKTAISVGKRHGKPVVLMIESKRMHDYGYKFFLSENGIPLTKYVPEEFINGLKIKFE